MGVDPTARQALSDAIITDDDYLGVFEIGKAQSAFYKEQTGWVFIAQAKEHLTGLPADPAALLGTLPKDYNVAVKVLGNNIPAELKQFGVDQIIS